MITSEDTKADDNKEDGPSEEDEEHVEEVQKVNFTSAALKLNLRNRIISEAEKIAVKTASVYVKDIIKDLKINPFKLYLHYVSGPNAICKIRRTVYQKRFEDLKKELDKLIPEFQKLCENNMTILTRLINDIKRDNNIEDPSGLNDDPEYAIDQDFIKTTLIENENEDAAEAVFRLYDLFTELVAICRSLREVKLIEEHIAYYKQKASGNKAAVPPTVKANNTKEDFSEWIKKKMNFKHI